MPPRKRPAATDATVSPAKRKKVRTSIIGEPDASETHTSGRPKRSSIGEPTLSATATKSTATNKAKPEAKRSTTKAQGTTAARGRGRPRKDATAPTEEQQAPETPGTSPSKPVSRPKKSASAKFTRVKSHNQVETATQEAPQSPKPTVAPTPKPKGRPKSNTTKATTAVGTGTSADKPKGKPKTTKAKEKVAASKTGTDGELDGLTANQSDRDAVDEDEGKQYWLMKAEPDSRVENGVDVKFSIDDLMNAKVPEGWDGKDQSVFGSSVRLLTYIGVRNIVARNRMRAMKKGDLAFFYHSNTKVPGVAGVMEIVEEHSIDGTRVNEYIPVSAS
jgi:predicted RNA-binding protein with PUA-like domain